MSDGRDNGKTIVIINPKDVSKKNWLYNTFLRNFLIGGGKKTRVNMLLEDVEEKEADELKEKGITFVDVEGGDIVYPEIVNEDTTQIEEMKGEMERLKFLIRFYDQMLAKNFSEAKLNKIMEGTTLVDGKRVKNMDLLSEAYDKAVEQYVEVEKK